MVVENKNISEAEYVGNFLLNLYHKRFFENSGKIEKFLIRREFQNYSTENPFPAIENVQLGTLLLKNKFLFNAKSTTKTSIFIIHMKTFRQFSNELLKRLDEAQKRETLKRITIEYPSGAFKELEKLDVDPNFKEENLTFKANYKEYGVKDFVLSSKGCYICQKNFKLEIDYIEHIEYHTQDSNFESLRSRSPNFIQFLRISYQKCKDSSLLRFCIESFHSDLKIYKVVIIRDTSMLYPQESDTPYSLSAGDKNYFYIDCHTFEIGYEQPVVIVFRDISSTDFSEMRIEQHHFLRMEPFIVDITNLVDMYIPKRGELTLKVSLKDYFPPRDLMESEMSTIYKNCPKFLEYELNNKVIAPTNIGDIYKLLLQLEETAIFSLYNKLTQKETTVTILGTDRFSIWLQLDYDINVEDILKEGDRVELSAIDSGKAIHPPRRNKRSGNPKIYGSIEHVYKKRIIFNLRNSKLFKPDKQYEVKLRPLRYHLILQYRALERLEYFHHIKKLLFPTKRWYSGEKIQISISAYNENLAKNPEQLEAVERIVHHMDSDAPYIIFGPPGTGKTTTIVEAIYQLRKDNPANKILVVGGSNACVDEIAIRLLEIFKKVDPLGKNLLRIYSSAQGKKSEYIDEKLIKISNLCHGYQFYPSLEIVYMYPIVFATLSIAAKYVHGGLASDHFSHIFVDECGSSTEPEVIAAIVGPVTNRTKVILAGDPKQLGPVLQSKTAEELGLGVSLLERLMNLECYQVEPESKAYDRSRQIRLTKNYRTHPSILHMSNELYYDNDLEACGETSVTSWGLNWYKLPSPNFPIIFHAVKGKSERRHGSQSLYNWAEMLVVMNYIKEMMYFGVNGRQIEQGDIGIVTPYKSQVNLIRKELDERKWFEIEVGSVEKFQGQERPVIVLSTVRSQTESLGFLVNPKRLNVSLTRAQALLIIVGNPETLSASSDFNYVINYCKDNGAFRGEKYSLSRHSSYSNLTTLAANDLDDEVVSTSNSVINETIKQLQTAKNDENIENNRQNRDYLPTARVQPLRNMSNPSVKRTTVSNKKVGDWLDNIVLEKKSSGDVRPMPNINKVSNHETKIHSVQPVGAAACPPPYNYPPVNGSTIVPSMNAASYVHQIRTEYPLACGQYSANHFNYQSPTPNSSYACSSGATTRITSMASQPVQPKPAETTPTHTMLHRDIRESEFWKREENNYKSLPVHNNNTNYNTAKPKPESKKDKPCVIL